MRLFTQRVAGVIEMRIEGRIGARHILSVLRDGIADIGGGHAIGISRGKLAGVAGIGLQLCHHGIEIMAHFHRISDRAERLGVQIEGATIPELAKVEGGVEDCRSVAQTSRSTNAFCQRQAVGGAHHSHMTGVAANAAVPGERGIMKQGETKITFSRIGGKTRQWRNGTIGAVGKRMFGVGIDPGSFASCLLERKIIRVDGIGCKRCLTHESDCQ